MQSNILHKQQMKQSKITTTVAGNKCKSATQTVRNEIKKKQKTENTREQIKMQTKTKAKLQWAGGEGEKYSDIDATTKLAIELL